MPQQRAEAFVLQTSPLGEQEKLVTFLSREGGVLKGIAKGARKFGNRFGSSLEPMSHVRIFYYEKEQRDLVTISDCDLLESYFEIQSKEKAHFTLGYFSELIVDLFPPRSGEDVLFRLLLSTLQALKTGADPELLGSYFEGWLLRLSGILPDFSRCRRCRAEAAEGSWLAPARDGCLCSSCATDQKHSVPAEMDRFLLWIRTNPPSAVQHEPFPFRQVKDIRKTFQEILAYHLEKEPRCLRYLK